MNTPKLRFHSIWFRLGLLGLLGLGVLALWPYKLDNSLPHWSDKALHVLAYMVIAGWFFQIYHQNWQRIMIALTLFAFGFGIELLQYFSPIRNASIPDLFANLVGLGAAWLLCLTPLQRTLIFFETRLLRTTRT